MPSLLIHLHSEGFERAYQALTLGLAARAQGQHVALVLAFGALRALAEDRLGEPLPGPDLWSARRAEQHGLTGVQKLLDDARAQELHFLAERGVAMASGLDDEQLQGKLELVDLARIANLQRDAQVIYL